MPTQSSTRLPELLDSDVAYSFRQSPVAIIAALVSVVMIVGAFVGPMLSPYDPYNLRTISLLDANLPPAWLADGTMAHPLGTDNQGRDLLTLMIYGLRLSLLVGLSSIAIATVFGLVVGLLAGYLGGWTDTILMRLADIQLSFPAILIALLVDGLTHAVIGEDLRQHAMFFVLVFAIAASQWVLVARTVRGIALVERNKEYVQVARMMDMSMAHILLRHITPNALGSVLVIMTINLAVAILLEATLSFLGVGLPPTSPSLGTLIRIGNEYLFSGSWWMSVFPGATLVVLALAVNLIGDWLRDALNPKLR